MSSGDEDRIPPAQKRPTPGEDPAAEPWRPRESSDQAPGEEVVQVNDAYAGGGPPPEEEPSRHDDQHRTGG
jgi:hypothetical protein